MSERRPSSGTESGEVRSVGESAGHLFPQSQHQLHPPAPNSSRHIKNSLSISAFIPPPVSSWLLMCASKDSTGGGGPPMTQLPAESFFSDSSWDCTDLVESVGSVFIWVWSWCCCCCRIGGGGSAGFGAATITGSIATLMFFSLVFPTWWHDVWYCINKR